MRWLRLSSIFLFAVAITAPALCQPSYTLPNPLPVDAVIQAAHEHRGEVAAALSRAQAAAQRPRIDSALPDPMVMASLDHLPFSLMGADVSLVVEQQFPLSGILSRRKRAAEAGARRQVAEADRTALDVELDAVSAYFMLFERRSMADVLATVDTLSKQLSSVATAHYAAAHGTQADALRAESEVLRVESELQALQAETRAAEAMLNAAVGRAPDLPVPALVLPNLDRPPLRLDVALATATAKRPELASMRHERSAALAEVDVMNAMYAPMAFVRTGPAYTMDSGAGVMLMLGVSVPIWRGRLNAGVEEANAMVRMASSDLAAMENMVRGEVAAARQEFESERIRFRALHEQVRPKAEQTVDAALASYGAAETSAVTVIDALKALWDVRAEEVMAETRLGLAWAKLRRATGELGRPEGKGP